MECLSSLFHGKWADVRGRNFCADPLDRETSSTTNQIILIDFLCSLALSFAHSLFAPQTLGILKRGTKHGFAVKVVVFVF